MGTSQPKLILPGWRFEIEGQWSLCSKKVQDETT